MGNPHKLAQAAETGFLLFKGWRPFKLSKEQTAAEQESYTYRLSLLLIHQRVCQRVMATLLTNSSDQLDYFCKWQVFFFQRVANALHQLAKCIDYPLQ
jgi:hypothetical protein